MGASSGGIRPTGRRLGQRRVSTRCGLGEQSHRSPFAETQEALSGYSLIDAPDREAAIEWAKKCPQPFGGVEVRQVMVFD